MSSEALVVCTWYPTGPFPPADAGWRLTDNLAMFITLPAAAATELLRVGSAAECTPTGGWHATESPGPAVHLCSVTCDAARSGAELEALIGCSGRWACGDVDCTYDAGPGACRYEGEGHADGTEWQVHDGDCTRCTCAGGVISCHTPGCEHEAGTG